MKILTALALGAICGAIAGAILLGMDAWLTPPPVGSTVFLGREGEIGIAIYGGIIWGPFPGAAIGLLVGLTNSGKLSGAIIGLIIGVIFAIYMFSTSTIDDTDFRRLAILSVPVATLVGVVVATLMSMLWSPVKHE